jgi:hypothetical protein
MTHGLRKTLLPLLCALAACAAIPASAGAVVVGIGDQTAGFMSSPLFTALRVHEARLAVPWDVATRKADKAQLAANKAWIDEALSEHITPLISFGRDNGSAGNTVPSVKQYTTAIKAFIKMFPKVRRYTAWNEPDWVYIKLGREPVLAAQYFQALVKSCNHCTALAGDVYLPAKQLTPWLKSYTTELKKLKVKPSGWALHNYYDVREHNADQILALQKLTSGPIWLDEISGVERRGHWQFKNQSEQAAANDEKFLFSLPKKYHRISRIYHYQWEGSPTAGWDSGLINPDGTPRPAYNTVKQAAA